MWFADEHGFYFGTETVKAFYRQLQANRKVQLCFHDAEAQKVMRVTGEVELLDDLKLKERVLQDLPFLKDLGIETPGDPILVIFRIPRGEAFFWTMENNMKESEIERIRFGK